MQQMNLSFYSLILLSQIDILTSLTKDIISEWEVSIYIAFFLANIFKMIFNIFRNGSFNMGNFTNRTMRIASEG